MLGKVFFLCFVGDRQECVRTVKIRGKRVIKIFYAFCLGVGQLLFQSQGRCTTHHTGKLLPVKTAAAAGATHLVHSAGTVIGNGGGDSHSIQGRCFCAFCCLPDRQTQTGRNSDHQSNDADENISAFGTADTAKGILNNVHKCPPLGELA